MRPTALILLALLAPTVTAAPDLADLLAAIADRVATADPGSPLAIALGAAPTGGNVPDAGYGARTGDFPCYVAALVTALRVTTDGVARNALDVDVPRVAIPQPTVPCGLGFTSWTGEVTARPDPDALDWTACVAYEGPLGVWAREATSCHVADFAEATIVGRVGVVDVRECWDHVCLTVEQIFGAPNTAPGHADAAVIAVR